MNTGENVLWFFLCLFIPLILYFSMVHFFALTFLDWLLIVITAIEIEIIMVLFGFDVLSFTYNKRDEK